MTAAALVLAALVSGSAHAQVSYGFDGGDEGWDRSRDGAVITWVAPGGNPGGYLVASDVGNGWAYVQAPEALVSAGLEYGGQILLDLRYPEDVNSDPPFYNVRVALTGNGLILISEREDTPPAASWDTYAFDIVETDRWRIFASLDQNYSESAPPPTEAELRSVLDDLDAFYVATDYSDATLAVGTTDIVHIDNVDIRAPQAVPLPGSALAGLMLLLLATAALARRDGLPTRS